MSIRNPEREELLRLELKTLEGRFRTILQEGLNCSPFEAEAVIGAVREVYFPWIDEASIVGPPGRVVLVAVAADEPAGKSISECTKQTISLLVHRGAEDDRLLQSQGPTAFRRRRLPDLCQEALSQGALLTREDLAYRIFFVSPRTISRDLAWLRGQEPAVPLPLRSLVHDIGPVLTHRVQIVRLALQGKITTEICRVLRHSPPAVANYLSTFTRCAQLAQRQLQCSQIAFLLRRGRGLITQYLDLLAECQRDPTMAYHLEQLLQIAQVGGKKKSSRRHTHAR
jgi:DNA-binding CsgD family transcriptional regulator